MPPARIPVLEAPLEQRIHHGAWAAFLVVLASRLYQVLSAALPLTWETLFDLPLVAALAYGLYRKSRVAAVAIVAYFVAVGALQFVRSRTLPLGPYIILAFFLGRAIPAVFRDQRAQSSSTPHVA